MKISKLFKLFVIVAVLMASSGCGKQEKEAQIVAASFLESYFKTDYETASALSTPELADEIITSFKSMESMEKGVREMILRQTSQMKTEITGIEQTGSKDSMIVSYKVMLPEFPKGLQNKLIMVRIEGNWKVGGFGE